MASFRCLGTWHGLHRVARWLQVRWSNAWLRWSSTWRTCSPTYQVHRQTCKTWSAFACLLIYQPCCCTLVLKTISYQIAVVVFFVHICTFARRPHSLTSPSGLRSFSALLAQIARFVSGTTCDDDRRSFRRQLLCRFSARSIVHLLALGILTFHFSSLHWSSAHSHSFFASSVCCQHLATPMSPTQLPIRLVHMCTTLRVADVGIHVC